MKLPKKIASLLTITLVAGSGLGNLTAEASKYSSSETIIGKGRWETAIDISKKGWSTSKEAVIVNDSALADALTATPFAEAKDAPILLTQNNKLDDRTKAELKRLGVKKVYLIGGESALSKSVENTLKSENIQIDRIWGSTRYETSLEIAKRLDSIKDVSEIAVVNGDKGIADAISIAPVAADKDMPIILSHPEKGTKTSDGFIKGEDIKTSYIIGGTTAVSNELANKLPNVKRLEGQNRNETNAKVIETFYTENELKNAYVAKDGIAKESELIDGLAIGVLAAKNDSPVILVRNKLNEKQKDVVNTKSFKIITQVGGGSNQNGFNELKSIQEITTYNVGTIAGLTEVIGNCDANDIININIATINEDIIIKTNKKISINLSGNYKNTITVSAPNAMVVNKGTISKLVVKDSIGGTIENDSEAIISNLEIQETASNIEIVNKGTITNIKNDAKGTTINNSGSITNNLTGNQTPSLEGNRPGGSTSGGSGSGGGGGGSTENDSLNTAKKSAVTELNGYKKQSDYNEDNWKEIEAKKLDWIDKINKSKTKDEVSKTLESAKSDIDSVKTNDQINQDMASDIIKIIDSIGEVTFEKKELIDSARQAYNKLKPEQQKLVTNIKTLELAEEAYSKIEAENNLDNAKKSAVEKLNNYKNQSDYNEGNWKKVVAKTEEWITNINKLTTIEDINQILESAKIDIDSIKTNEQISKEEISNVINLIDSIEEVTFDKKELIENARKAYDNLTSEQKELVTNIEILKSAEETYSKIESEDNLNKAKKLAVEDLESYKDQSKYSEENWNTVLVKRAEWRIKINELTEIEDVNKTLELAKTDIDTIETNDKTNEEAIENVIKLIDSIDEVTFEDKGLIESAREAYNNLTPEQKEFVKNINKLNDAEEAYPKVETYHYFNQTKESMNEIPGTGNVKIEDKDKIYKARENLNKINYGLLSGNRFSGDKATYNVWSIKLKAIEVELGVLIELDKPYTEAANAVITKINAIGKVEATDESWKKIEDARNAYNTLNDRAKSKITKEQLKVLEDAEAEYKNLNPIYEIRSEAIKGLNSYVNLEHYDDNLKETIKDYINEASIKINESKEEEVIIEIVNETKMKIDSIENSAQSMRNTNREKFEELVAWKNKMEELKANIDDKIIIGIIDTQIWAVENVGLTSVDINNNTVTINKVDGIGRETYNVNDEHQTYKIESAISKAIDAALKRAEDGDNIVQGKIGEIIEKILGDGFSINVGNYAVQEIPIPAGMNKENTIQALADLLTIKDFDININPKTGLLEIPSDKLDFEALEEILQESGPSDTKISIEDLISIIKKIPTLRLNLKWDTNEFSSELGADSKVNANIGLSINLEDIIDLATDPFFEKIISELLQGQDINLSLIKSLADYLQIDLSNYNVGVNYGIDFKFKVIDIALNTEIILPTLKLPKEIDEGMVNTILDEISKDYIGKILDIEYSSNELLFSVISDWDKYNKDLTEITGTIQIKIGDIVLSNHKTVVPIEHIDVTDFIEVELAKLRTELENILNEANNNEKVLEIIKKVKELKDFINSLPNLDEDTKNELELQIEELELKAKELQ